ncbi:hypothetical protein HDV00_006554 [Rhizophlyctis rosea]|nr:hypothetical protein HDV00_006554 [Rhizophlyctis rosea]
MAIATGSPLPVGLNWLTPYEFDMPSNEYFRWKLKKCFTSWTPGKYEALVMYLQADQTAMNISFGNDNHVDVQGNLFEADWSPQLYTRFTLSNNGSPTMRVRFAGYLGNVDGTRATVTPATDDNPDTGALIQWLCEDTDSLRFYPDLADVRIQAFRDANVGIPVPLQRTDAVFSDGIWQINRIWGGPKYYDAYLYPHPELACAAHNADYIEIGDFNTASYILVAWMPQWRIEQTHATGAYAPYVKQTRDANYKDTIAVHMRIRVSLDIGDVGTPWVSEARPNCTAAILAARPTLAMS